MKTTVVGSWHLASVYAVGLCRLGHEVCIITSEKVRRDYENGKPPVRESGTEEGVERFFKEGRLSFSSEAANAAEVCFFAEDCKVTESGVDMEWFNERFDPFAKSSQFKIIAVSSQLPLGTCRELQRTYPEAGIVYFPEFLRLGDALERFLKPDYMVMGGEAEHTKKVLSLFSEIECPKFEVTLEEAEMAKHAANIFAALSVSFVSELTKLSEQFNVDLEKVGKILRTDKRVGPKAYVMPGMGFSGETVERDIRVLINLGQRAGISLPLFEQVIAVNNEHNLFIEKKLNSLFSDFAGAKIGFLGATYKPFTSTLRGSLIAPLMEALAGQGVKVALYDPHVEVCAFLVKSPREIFEGSDAVVISVPKKEFREIPYGEFVGTMKKKIIIDAANLLEKDVARALGLERYFSIGRGRVI